MTTAALSQTIRIATLGDIDQNSAKFSLADRQVPIIVSISENARRDLSTLENLPVPTSRGGSVPLKSVAEIGFGSGPTTVQRTDQIRRTLVARLRDSASDETGQELINIFIQSGAELFDFRTLDASQLHLGPTSVLASQPEFGTGERLKSLIDLTDQRDLLATAVGNREHRGRIRITIGGENDATALSDFTLVTAEYSVGGLRGVIGVITPCGGALGSAGTDWPRVTLERSCGSAKSKPGAVTTAQPCSASTVVANQQQRTERSLTMPIFLFGRSSKNVT